MVFDLLQQEKFQPKIKPDSATIDFWDEWDRSDIKKGIKQAVEALRKQQK
jgi:hypothetical protein